MTIWNNSPSGAGGACGGGITSKAPMSFRTKRQRSVGIQVLLWCLALPNGFIMTGLPRLRLAMTIWNNSPPMAGCPSGRGGLKKNQKNPQKNTFFEKVKGKFSFLAFVDKKKDLFL